jgi:hypothetical protein
VPVSSPLCRPSGRGRRGCTAYLPHAIVVSRQARSSPTSRRPSRCHPAKLLVRSPFRRAAPVSKAAPRCHPREPANQRPWPQSARSDGLPLRSASGQGGGLVEASWARLKAAPRCGPSATDRQPWRRAGSARCGSSALLAWTASRGLAMPSAVVIPMPLADPRLPEPWARGEGSGGCVTRCHPGRAGAAGGRGCG